MKQVRISRRYFLTMGKYFRQSCIFVTVLHPLSLSTSFTAVLQLFIQAGVRFLFTAWHHFRLDGQSGLWISLSNILKCFVTVVGQVSSEAFMHIWQKIKMALNLAVLDCWVALSWEWFQAGAKDVLSLWESCHHFNKRVTRPLFLVLSSLPDSMSVLSRFLSQADFSSPKSLFPFISLSHSLPSPPFFSWCCCCGKMKAAEWSGGGEGSGNQRAQAAGAVWRQVGDTSKSGVRMLAALTSRCKWPPAINRVPGVNLWVHTHTNAITFLRLSQNLLVESSNKILALFLGRWLLQMWRIKRQIPELLIAGGGRSLSAESNLPPYCPICS